MNIFVFALCLCTYSIQGIIPKFYQAKNDKINTFIFSSIVAIVAGAIFLIKIFIDGNGFNYSVGAMAFSIIYAVCYAMCFIFQVLAFKYGPLSLTALFLQLSLIIPVCYGLFFLKESLSIFGYIAIGILLLSMLFLNLQKDKKNFSIKWIIFVLLACFGNGVCSITQKEIQVKYSGLYKNEYMIVGLLIASVIMFICGIIYARQQGTKLLSDINKAGFYSIACGFCNGITSLLILIIVGYSSASWFYPMLAGCGIVFSFVISYFLFKEKISKTQIVGYVLGLIAVVLLNI